MALVTVQRSPCGSTSVANCHCQTTDETDGSDSKEEGDEKKTEKKNVSECYFVVKGAALVLPHDECLHVYRKTIANGASDIQQHLQAMFYLLHPNDILKMAVKLESVHSGRTRYLAVVSCTGKLQTEESCLLGIDCNSQTTIGLVLPVWADTRITLDGDGGFSVTSSGRHHIFKPVSVQAMWSALQTLHKASSKAREYNYFMCGGTHQWIEYYEKHISSDRSCLNEWHAMDDIESRRPPSPDTVRSEPTEREATEKHIRAKLKELMMSVDLDEVTSKYIRTRLEDMLDMNLKEYKPFIDQEMLTILGQMDAPTEIFQYLYLGSEWNASNLEELKVNGIGHILNVTREIDNFFPGMFDYQNVRVYDDESTEMLQYWDKTYRYIRRAKDDGSKVLVHCKMGISRSASVVIAYVMKAYDWNLQQALSFVKNKRNCIKPNSGFLKQLEIYQGILNASKHRHNSLWRSKSETNLKSPDKPKKTKSEQKKDESSEKLGYLRHLRVPGTVSRPKSWSPDDSVADMLFAPNSSLSNEALIKSELPKKDKQARQRNITDPFTFSQEIKPWSETEYMLNSQDEMPSATDLNKNAELLNIDVVIHRVSSIKDRINELESHVTSSIEAKTTKTETKSPNSQSRSGLVLNLANQFESGSKPASPVDEGLTMKSSLEQEIVEPVVSQMKPPASKHHAVLVKPSLWPSEENSVKSVISASTGECQKSDASVFLKLGSDIDTDHQLSKVECKEHAPCSCKKQSDNITSASSAVPSTKHLSNPLSNATSSSVAHGKDGILSPLEKPSHYIQDSFSKPLSINCSENTLVKSEENVNQLQQNLMSTCLNSAPLNSLSEKKQSTGNACILKMQIDGKPQGKLLVVDGRDGNKGQSSENSTLQLSHCQNLENITPQKPSVRISQTCDISPDENSQNVPSKVDFFYDKEDIPWTPGTVQRTKQQIEEKNLTRTTSFDSGFPTRPQSTPSTPPDSTSGKPVQRSHSLRSDHRPTSMFAGKWYPLPALASPAPKLYKGSRETLSSCYVGNERCDMVHSISTPSVVEAVNQVICGTQEVLTSAIQSLPTDRQNVPPSHHSSCTASVDFGSASSLPDIEVADLSVTFEEKTPPLQSESPIPGTVKQQCEILENKTPKLTPNEKTALDCCKNKKDLVKPTAELSSSLVSNDSTNLEDKDFGIVKRLTKELEAKTSTEVGKKDKTQISVKEGKDNELEKEIKSSAKGKSLSTPSSPEMDSISRTAFVGPELNLESRHRQRSYVGMNSGGIQAPNGMQQAPPTPHRKTSLDLNFLRKSSQCSLTVRLGSNLGNTSSTDSAVHETNVNSQNSNKASQPSLKSSCFQRNTLNAEHQQVESITDSHRISPGRPPPAAKTSPNYTVMPPPPPPPPPVGPPRKVRKQQGSTHPLSKLTIRQRHANPLYNTM